MRFSEEEIDAILEGLRRAQRGNRPWEWIRFKPKGVSGIYVTRSDGETKEWGGDAFVAAPDFPEYLP